MTPNPPPREHTLMNIAYLVNQYPHVSHSFIRREIAAVETTGAIVHRFAIRTPGELVDAADQAEAGRTRSLLAAGFWPMLWAALAATIQNPSGMMRAFAAAMRMGARAGNRPRHLAYFAEACLLLRWLKKCQAKHLHAHFGTNPAAVARLTRILGGPPYSFTIHGPEEFDRPESLSLREKIADAEFVVAISSFGRSQLYRWADPDDWSKIRVVRCGVDSGFLAGGPRPLPKTSRLVCVGRLAEQKGQLLLLAAAGRLAAAGYAFELVLAGDGPMRPLIEQAIRIHNLDGRVRITGWLSNDAVRAEMLDARAVVLPSFAEGLPVVLMEALALGRPVIATHIAGIPELVRDGINGWLVPAGDVSALTDALAQVLSASLDDLAIMGATGARAVQLCHDATREGARLATHFAHPAGTKPPINSPSPHTQVAAPGRTG